jgi:signal transduction protein with GAF and PtsI domain
MGIIKRYLNSDKQNKKYFEGALMDVGPKAILRSIITMNRGIKSLSILLSMISDISYLRSQMRIQKWIEQTVLEFTKLRIYYPNCGSSNIIFELACL